MRLSRRHLLALSAAGAAGMTACASAAPAGPGLRAIADAAGLRFGTAVGPMLFAAGDYRDAVLRDCNTLVCEYEMKWDQLAPAPDRSDFAAADRHMAFAAANGIEMRGHTLAWHRALPRWFGATASPANAGRLLSAHIAASVGRYAGRIRSWDVVNEAVEPEHGEPGGLRRTPLLQLLGPGHIDLAFRAAAAADPAARLVYNDYGLVAPWDEPKRRATLALLEGLVSRGVPVHALGLQGHLDLSRDCFDPEIVHRFAREVAALGLEIVVTELDVADDLGPADIAARDAAIAAAYRNFLDAVLAVPQVTGVVTWGLSDRHSWIAKERPRPDGLPTRPLLYDRDMAPKPAWHAVAAALRAAPRRRAGG
ncbi:MAG TPA: endo-1,4-beta-xylanase [Alphaproteobacteria bacterium]|nr:endo-1,4-beta-xylanase [Alphaproteobacteria bacterium]